MEVASQWKAPVGADTGDQFRVLLAKLEQHHKAALAAATTENATLKKQLEASELEIAQLRAAATAMRKIVEPEHLAGLDEEVEVGSGQAWNPAVPHEVVANRVSKLTARIEVASRQVETSLENNGNIESNDPDEESPLPLRPSVVAPGMLATPSSGWMSSRRSDRLLSKAMAQLESANSLKKQQHFRNLLDLRGNVVTAHDIMKVLQKRREDFSMEQASMVIEELRELQGVARRSMRSMSIVSTSHGLRSAIELESFVQLMTVPELPSDCRVSPEVLELRKILEAPDLDDVIHRVTKSHASTTSKLFIESSLYPVEPCRQKLLAVLNAVVWVCVVASIASLGVSADLAPTWMGWFAAEVAFGAVFVAEVILKICLLGFNSYVRGPSWRWNCLDFGITVVTTLDLTLSSALRGSVEGRSGVKISMVFRVFRMARIARLVKLLHLPILADLANLLAGFQVGIPCMLWVMMLLCMVFYVVGIILRQTMGPSPGVSHIAECGYTGDSVPLDHEQPMCQPHILYGEEFFGKLPKSMFTVFRCVLGDCTTERGISLTAAFSRGYGIIFELMYCCGMVLIVVGLFNIIAAIFVDTTISGLKYNNVQRKYARAYESKYVEQRLEELVARVRELHWEAGGPHIHFDTGEFALNEVVFNNVMQDEEVNAILEDLDVAVNNQSIGLFDLFDSDNNGLVSMSDLVGTLMKIRGGPQKSDVIASWVTLRSLNDRFQEFERLVLENQMRLLNNQRDLLAKCAVARPHDEEWCV